MGSLHVRGGILQRVLSIGGRKAAKKRAGRAASRRLRLEPLEVRAMMSATAKPLYVVINAHSSKTIDAGGPITPADVKPMSTTSPTGLTPAQVRGAYRIDQDTCNGIQGSGAGETIAIVDAYDAPNLIDSTDANFANSDLHRFDQQFGLPDPPSFRKVGSDGSNNLPAASGTTGWAVEVSLDVEWAHTVAPAANIVLVEANDAYMSSLMAAVDTARNLPGVCVVSMSFGCGEYSGESSNDSYFTTPAGHSGVTFVASTGDWGSPGVYPAMSSNVLAVGRHDALRFGQQLRARDGLELQRRRSEHAGSRARLPTRGAEFRLAANPRRGVRRRSQFGRAGPRFVRLRQPVAVAPGWRHQPVGALLGRIDRHGRSVPRGGQTAFLGRAVADAAQALQPAGVRLPRHHQRQQRRLPGGLRL